MAVVFIICQETGEKKAAARRGGCFRCSATKGKGEGRCRRRRKQASAGAGARAGAGEWGLLCDGLHTVPTVFALLADCSPCSSFLGTVDRRPSLPLFIIPSRQGKSTIPWDRQEVGDTEE